jgi:membrane protein
MARQWWSLTRDTARAWFKYECTSLAAAIAFYAALSLFPLMIALIAGVGSFLEFTGPGRDARAEVLATVAQQISPQMSEALATVLSQIQEGAATRGPVAGIVFLLSASLVFAQIDRGFIRIWDVRQRPGRRGIWSVARRLAVNRLWSLLLLAGTGMLVVLVFAAGLALRAATRISREWFPEAAALSGAGSLGIGLATNLLAFSLLYHLLSKEHVRWPLCLKSGLLAALLWEIGSRFMTWISFGENYTPYGIVGSFLVVLLWIFYNVTVLFVGALVVRVRTRPLDSSPR